ncbi:MAG TPA: EAL domain-containing protein [Paracoccus sp.]|nr:EAL domain-containing protein [Paracoccus sp. (in: a-proteobacteria)]
MKDAAAGTGMALLGPAMRWFAMFLPVPLLTLVMLGGGQPPWLVLAVVGAQIGWLGLGLRRASAVVPPGSPHGYAGATDAETVTRLMAEGQVDPVGLPLHGAALVIRLDDSAEISERHGTRFAGALMHELARRLGRTLREHDAFCQLGPAGFGIALVPHRNLDTAAVLMIAHRIQSHLGHAFSFESVSHWPSVSVGFCLSPRSAAQNGIGMLEAAAQAAERALRVGPAGLYSYSAVDLAPRPSNDTLERLHHALESGEICAYFQPQICTRTGRVSGLEALARWRHPDDGLIPPARFLPLIEGAGMSSMLAERMLRDALGLLKHLDAMGLGVPLVSVNLSGPELRNPNLVDEIAWELDRHDLRPERLVLEILETVAVDSDDDIILRNIVKLSGMGCGIDLDDFGTGHAAIANIRRFAVGRIKIDRSFVTHLHKDREQQRMVSAILSMARQLGLGTVAEGVETDAELALITQLGCDHAQGFGIARPMPGADLPEWLYSHAPAKPPPAAPHNSPASEPIGAPVP